MERKLSPIKDESQRWWNQLSPKTRIDIYQFMSRYVSKKDERVEIKIEEAKEKYGKEIAEIRGWFWKFYRAKFGIDPIENFAKSTNALRGLCVQKHNMTMIESCIPIYLEMNNQYLINRNFPLELFPQHLDECRNTILQIPSKSEITSEERFKKMLEYYIDKYNIKNEERNQQ